MDIDYTSYHRDEEYKKSEKLFKNIFKKRYNIISKYMTNPQNVLDIGCSNGTFLDLYKNSETWGVEPSASSKQAIDKKHNIINTVFEKAKLPQDHFDLIIMNHTLEHVRDAELVLAKIYRLLKKDGILFIDVPNAGGMGSKLFGDRWPHKLPDEHTYQFTKESLSKIIVNSGFLMLHWESRSGLLEFANPVLELFLSLFGLKKRFFNNLITLPYSLVATVVNMGDSMSFVCKKV